MASYWPLEESSGSLVHDVSIYGSTQQLPNTVEWDSSNDLRGKLLFAKHFLADDATGLQLFPKGIACSASSCLYCSTPDYCKSCSSNTYLEAGNCVSITNPTIAGFYMFDDSLEREFRLYPSDGCVNPLCKKCDDQAHAVCASNGGSVCVLHGKKVGSDCLEECPENQYPSEANYPSCNQCNTSLNCLRCESSDVCTACRPGYILHQVSSVLARCKEMRCGDGIVEAPEECDDGNIIPGDGCDENCRVELHFECTLPNPHSRSVCNPICGDGVFTGLGDEECDDGGVEKSDGNGYVGVGGDGCSATCKVESGWWCHSPQPGARSYCYCSPKVVAAALSEDCMRLSYRFNKELDRYEGVANLCEHLFGSSAKQFGKEETYSCSIQGDTLTINLGEDNTIYSNLVLQTVNGIILPYAQSENSCSQVYPYSTNLTVPSIPKVDVEVLVTIPEETVHCEEVQIVVTEVKGGLNRPFKEMFFIATVIKSDRHIEEKLTNAQMVSWLLSEPVKVGKGVHKFVLPANSLLPDAKYKMELHVTNFQGSGIESTYYMKVNANILLTLFIEGATEGSTKDIFRHEELVVRVSPRLVICNNLPYTTSNITIDFTEPASKYIHTPNRTADRLLRIPPNTLAPDTYHFKVTAALEAASVKAEKEFAVRVANSPAKAVAQPRFQVLGSEEEFEVLGGEEDLGNEGEVEYLWECNVNSTVHTETKKTLVRNTRDWFNFEKKMEVVCKLTVRNADTGQESYAYAKLMIVDTKNLSISVKAPEGKVQPNATVFIYPEIKRLPANCRVAWEIQNCEETFVDYSQCSKTISCTKCAIGNINEHYVRLDISRFSVKESQLNLAMAVVKGEEVVARKVIDMEVDAVPKKGSLVWTQKGSVAAAEFSLQASGFEMPGEVVRYEFFYKQIEDETYDRISIRSAKSEYITKFPLSLLTSEQALDFMVRAYNERDGYIEGKITVRLTEAPNQTETLLQLYENLISSIDFKNPQEHMNTILLFTHLLSPKAKAAESEPCSGNGKLTNGKCYCQVYYEARPDCSIHRADFEQQKELAERLLRDIQDIEINDKSVDMKEGIIEAIGNIARTSDLLEESARKAVRGLLARSIRVETLVSTEKLAYAIDFIAVMAQKADKDTELQAQTEYNQVFHMIDLMTTKELKSNYKAKRLEYDLNNINVQSYIFSSTESGSLISYHFNITALEALMGNSKGHITVNMIEWKNSVYTWKLQDAGVISRVTTLYVKDANGVEIPFDFLYPPIWLRLAIDVGKHTAVNLTNMRCVSYNKTDFSFELVEAETVDVQAAYGICKAYHLTDFAMVVPLEGSYLFAVRPNPIPIDTTSSNSYSLKNSPLFWFTIAITILLTYAVLWGYCKEKSESELNVLMNNRAYAEQKYCFQDGDTSATARRVLQTSGSRGLKQPMSKGESEGRVCSSRAETGAEALSPVVSVQDNPAAKLKKKEREELEDVKETQGDRFTTVADQILITEEEKKHTKGIEPPKSQDASYRYKAGPVNVVLTTETDMQEISTVNKSPESKRIFSLTAKSNEKTATKGNSCFKAVIVFIFANA